ncbi:hypothetical protein ACT7DA_07200 [Bacillus pacificus]
MVRQQLAPNFGLLLTGRMVQAAEFFSHGTFVNRYYASKLSERKRGTAMGIFGLVMITAPAIGPTLSGYIVEVL